MGVFTDAFLQSLMLIFSLDKEIMDITFLSLKVSTLAVLFSMMIGIPLALVISNNKFYFRNLAITIIHTFMALPPVVAGLIVYMFLSRNGTFGFLDLLYTPTAMILAQMILTIPIITGISLSTFNEISKQMRETIKTLGATKIQYAIKFIKESKYGLITAIITSFGAAISEVGAILIVGGNIEFYTRTLTTAIVLETRRGDFALAMGLGIILIALAFMINFALTYVQQQKTSHKI